MYRYLLSPASFSKGYQDEKKEGSKWNNEKVVVVESDSESDCGGSGAETETCNDKVFKSPNKCDELKKRVLSDSDRGGVMNGACSEKISKTSNKCGFDELKKRALTTCTVKSMTQYRRTFDKHFYGFAMEHKSVLSEVNEELCLAWLQWISEKGYAASSL